MMAEATDALVVEVLTGISQFFPQLEQLAVTQQCSTYSPWLTNDGATEAKNASKQCLGLEIACLMNDSSTVCLPG